MGVISVEYGTCVHANDIPQASYMVSGAIERMEHVTLFIGASEESPYLVCNFVCILCMSYVHVCHGTGTQYLLLDS